MNKLKLWIKKLKFKLSEKERLKYIRTDYNVKDKEYVAGYTVTAVKSSWTPYELFVFADNKWFTTINAFGSIVSKHQISSCIAYFDEEGYLCREDTQGYHNSKL